MERKKRSPIWKISIEEFKKIIDESSTMKEVLSYFGLMNKGGNHNTVKRRCKKEGVSLDGLKERSIIFRADKTFISTYHKSIPLEDVLIENSSYDRGHLKKRLILSGLIVNMCSRCGLKPEWCEESLCLVLDHINGVPDDNRIENLRLLCPNCNAQTSTFAGKKRKLVGTSGECKKKKNGISCIKCGVLIGNKTKNNLCLSCFAKGRRKVDRPSKDELCELISNTSMVKIGKKFGVSDTAVRKWAKSYGLL